MGGFSPTSPDWAACDYARVTGPVVLREEVEAHIPLNVGGLSLCFYDGFVRLRLGEQRGFDYGILHKLGPASKLAVQPLENGSLIKGGDIEFEITHDPFTFEFRHQGRVVQRTPRDGHFVRQYRQPPLARLDNGWFLNLELQSSEPVYGLGEKWGKLDKRGQFLRSYNEDALGVNAEISYKNAPFGWSPEGWGVFVHTPSPVTHAVGYAPWSQRAYGVLVEDEELDVFLFAGENGAALLDQYTQLTGRAPVPPDWSLGVILSKAYYRTADEILSVAKEVRERGMPCDTITFDGRAWQDTDTRFAFEWDPARYPDPKAVLDELKAMDFKICVWEYPLISVKNPLFKEWAEKGWLLKDKRTGEAYEYDWDVGPFGKVLTPLPRSGLIDFTNAEAYAFWRDSHKPLFDMGVDMIKADFAEQVNEHMVAHNGESGHALHNVYALLYNRCVYEAAERYSKNGPFLFSRAAWSSQQRYPSQWGGDPQADWGGMAGNIRGGVSWGMTGAPFYATDIGGFYKDERDAELFVRWAQAGVFSAHMRLHGIGPREPWSYGEEAEQAANEALKLRYRLLPYLKKAMVQAHEAGLPVQRAMALAFPDDRASWAFEDQFMFGDDILFAPCLRPGGEVRVYLPKGQWVGFPNGERFEGGQLIHMKLGLNDFAAFARADVKIPLGPVVSHVEELVNKEAIEEYWPQP